MEVEEEAVNIYWGIYGSNNLLRFFQGFYQPSKPLIRLVLFLLFYGVLNEDLVRSTDTCVPKYVFLTAKFQLSFIS